MFDLHSSTPSLPIAPGRPVRPAALLLAGLTLVMLAFELFTPRPLETHEVFVAQTAREMLARGDWVLPRFNDEVRLNKPPLAYWAVMAIERLLPSDPPVPEWKARLPSVVASALLTACTFGVAACLYDPRRRRTIGLLAALLVIGSSGVFRYGANARPEMLYAACCALMLLGLAQGWSAPDRSRTQARWAGVVWAGFALSVLAKGPHFPLLILAGAAAHAWSQGRIARLRHTLRPHWGVPMMLALSAPWFIAVWLRAPQAGGVWFGQLSDAHDRPDWSLTEFLAPYYLWGLPQIMLPWIILLPFGVASCFVREPTDLRRGRLLLWVFGVVLITLSLTTHRRSYYMLPMLPALAPLMAAGTFDALRKVRGRLATWLHAALWGAALLTVALFAALGTQTWAWGHGGATKDAFARRVADRAGSDPVYLVDERAGIITYRVGRPTPVLDSPELLPGVLRHAPGTQVWAVMPPSLLSKVPPSVQAETIETQDTGEAGEALVLTRIRPSRPADPPR